MGTLDSLTRGAAKPTTTATLTMLNGAKSQSFSKELPNPQGTAMARDPSDELKVGIQLERFYFPKPHLQEGSCNLGLAYSRQLIQGSFGYPVSMGEIYPSPGDLFPGMHDGEGCYPPAVLHMSPRGPLYAIPG
ncbi:UNVERIFIED_CONTAM: hypothetical protein K2H54_037737 [Gekko kuhli]